jgi:hypothetical protein
MTGHERGLTQESERTGQRELRKEEAQRQGWGRQKRGEAYYLCPTALGLSFANVMTLAHGR